MFAHTLSVKGSLFTPQEQHLLNTKPKMLLLTLYDTSFPNLTLKTYFPISVFPFFSLESASLYAAD